MAVTERFRSSAAGRRPTKRLSVHSPLFDIRRATTVARPLLLALACVAVALLSAAAGALAAGPAASATASPLPPGEYETRRVCETPPPGQVSCMCERPRGPLRRGSRPPAPAGASSGEPTRRPLTGRRRFRPSSPGPARGLLAPHQRPDQPDDRDRRRLQRPRGRSRPAHLRRSLLAAGVHDRQRLLQAGQPERRNRQPAVPENPRRTRSGAQRKQSRSRKRRRSHRLGPRDLARHRDRPRRLPVLQHPPGRGQRTRRPRPRSRRARRRDPRRDRDLQLLRWPRGRQPWPTSRPGPSTTPAP